MDATVALPEHITFVTGNPGKVAELRHALDPLGIEVRQDGRGYPEVQADTLGEVAEAGARHLLAAGLEPPFLLEDAGLFIAVLHGFPGVYSRYALDTIGNAGLLRLMRDAGPTKRAAAFHARLQYVDADGALHGFEGTVKGRIADREAGSEGFGFDPIFVPEGHIRTFSEMDTAEKGAMSHRGRAVEAFLGWLQNQ